MNIVIISTGLSPITNSLLKSEYNVVGLVECSSRSYRDTVKSRSVRWLKNLLFPSLNIRKYAKNKGCKYFFLKDSGESLVSWLETLNVDLIIVQSMSRLLGESVIDIPRYGVLNIHRSYLPEYRGPNPLFWQYYDYSEKLGLTIHFIDKGEDTGGIVIRRRYPFSRGLTSREVNQFLLKNEAPKLLLRSIEDIQQGTVEVVSQKDLESPTVRARNISPSEHGSFIDWQHWPVERIWHFLKGTQEWLDELPQPKGIYKSCRWEVLDFSKRSGAVRTGHYQINKIKSDIYCLDCGDGQIFLRKDFIWKRFFLNLYRKLNG